MKGKGEERREKGERKKTKEGEKDVREISFRDSVHTKRLGRRDACPRRRSERREIEVGCWQSRQIVDQVQKIKWLSRSFSATSAESEDFGW